MLNNKHEYIEPLSEGMSEEDLREFRKSIDETFQDIGKKYYHTNGFAHDKVPVVTYTEDKQLRYRAGSWGLIPKWVRKEEDADSIRKRTINARGETITIKPSFRDAARNGRVIIPMDGFFEHHHCENGITVPYYITPPKGIFLCAGLAHNWLNRETGEEILTFTIVTCPANDYMAQIHNNPKAKEPRMPLFLSPRKAKIWMDPELDSKELTYMILPYEKEMRSHPVQKLRGKYYIGNNDRAIERFEYEGAPEFGNYKPKKYLF